jgi:hypothetical protein
LSAPAAPRTHAPTPRPPLQPRPPPPPTSTRLVPRELRPPAHCAPGPRHLIQGRMPRGRGMPAGPRAAGPARSSPRSRPGLDASPRAPPAHCKAPRPSAIRSARATHQQLTKLRECQRLISTSPTHPASQTSHPRANVPHRLIAHYAHLSSPS